MLATDMRLAMQRIKELQALQNDVASGYLEASDEVKETIVFRLNNYKATLRGVLAREYLEALDRQRYLTSMLESMSEWNAPKNMNFLGELLRRFNDAKENLKVAALAIKACANAGVI